MHAIDGAAGGAPPGGADPAGLVPGGPGTGGTAPGGSESGGSAPGSAGAPRSLPDGAKTVLGATEIRRALTRVAHEILEPTVRPMSCCWASRPGA